MMVMAEVRLRPARCGPMESRQKTMAKLRMAIKTEMIICSKTD